MKLTGLHLLLTSQCNFECDHCFVWGSPRQSGTMTFREITQILQQATDLGTIESVYFEGGEPFLYYAVLVAGVREARRRGFGVGIVSNGYWATSVEDARLWLEPFAGMIDDLSVSSDLFHYDEQTSRQAQNASAAAAHLGIPLGVISIARPDAARSGGAVGQLPAGESGVMYRGRAADKLSHLAPRRPWDTFTECPHEDLREPGRIHVDPLGNLQICQGIVIGSLWDTPLAALCEHYRPDEHPVTGALLKGGPVELVRRYGLPHAEAYADACHLCYESRRLLRRQFPEILKPDSMYGVPV
ncbi:MAG: radical SAM protein [Anaerolineae bacterium]